MTTTAINKIIIAGSGLASWMTAAALSKNLPSTIEITILDTPDTEKADVFYGTVTPPSSYDFFLKLGLSEAELVTRSNSSFSYGTQYKNWGLTDASWVQCYHSLFPSWNGVPLSHHISANSETLETYLVSAQAGLNGKFAHPPADRNIVLSSAEFGYHIKPHEITKLMKMIALKNGVKLISQQIKSIETQNSDIAAITLANNEVITADLYIDTTGQEAKLLRSLADVTLQTKRTLGASYTELKSEMLGPPLRRISSHKYGWQVITPLQDSDSILTIFDPSDGISAQEAHAAQTTTETVSSQIDIGHRKTAWSGNCVAIGHAAAAVDPISPAPITLLQLDITRLMGLIPVSRDFNIEANIFNEAYFKDVKNVELFNGAFYLLDNLPDDPYSVSYTHLTLPTKA